MSVTVWPIVPTPMVDDDECGAFGGMSSWLNLSTQRKTAPDPLYLPHIPDDMTRARSLAASVGSQRQPELWHDLDI
jgi:hypothetical protein